MLYSLVLVLLYSEDVNWITSSEFTVTYYTIAWRSFCTSFSPFPNENVIVCWVAASKKKRCRIVGQHLSVLLTKLFVRSAQLMNSDMWCRFSLNFHHLLFAYSIIRLCRFFPGIKMDYKLSSQIFSDVKYPRQFDENTVRFHCSFVDPDWCWGVTKRHALTLLPPIL